MGASEHDRILVSRLLRADEGAFAEFFESHFPPAFEGALRRAGNDREAAEAIAASGMREALLTLPRWRSSASLQEWVETRCAEAAPIGVPESEPDSASRVRAVVYPAWVAYTTHRAERRVFTSLALVGTVVALVILFNCPR